MYLLLNLNKKQQSTYNEIESVFRNIDRCISKLTNSMEIDFNEGILEAIQPMTDVVMRVAWWVVFFIWFVHFIDVMLKKNVNITIFDIMITLTELAVGIMAIGMAQWLCLRIIDISNNVMFAFNSSTTSLTIGESFLNMKEVAKQLEDMSKWDLTWLRLSLVVSGLTLDLMMGFMKMLVEFRMMNVAVFLVWSPIAFSSACLGVTRPGKFLRGFTATCFQGAYSVVCFKLYEIFVSKEFFLDGIDGAFWMIVLYTGGLLFLVFNGKGFIEKYLLP